MSVPLLRFIIETFAQADSCWAGAGVSQGALGASHADLPCALYQRLSVQVVRPPVLGNV